MKNHDVKVSVIVTVHNAGAYLQECLASVVSQTFPAIEILCIDGGSTDASPQILQQYAAEDARLRVINDPNTSYGHKVNRGIQEAQGEYISVLESDDLYRPDMLARLHNIAERYHPDFVNANYVEFLDIEGTRYSSLVRMYPQQDYNRLLESGKHPEDMRQIPRYWTGLFQKDFLIRKGIRMNESPGASYQDLSFRFLTSALADTCYHLDVPVYCYRIDNPNSSIYDPKKVLATADEFDFLKRQLEQKHIENIYIWRQFYIWKYNDLFGNLLRFSGPARQALLDRCCRESSLDRVCLETYQVAQYSQAARSFLEKPQEKLWAELEAGFQNSQTRFQNRIQMYKRLEGHQVVICGCGQRGKKAFCELYSVRQQICCFADNDEKLWRCVCEDIPVLPVDEAAKKYPDALYIVANKYFASEISQQLCGLGIAEAMIHIFWHG